MTETRQYFTPRMAADFLGYALATLDIWRSEGRGPAYIQNARIRYRRDDLVRWADTSGKARKDFEASLECHQARLVRVKRPRGRIGTEKRVRRLAAEPFCRICLETRGVQRKSEEVDHIIRLEFGGSDDDSNIRCLCKPCHANLTRDPPGCSEVRNPAVSTLPEAGPAEREERVGGDEVSKWLVPPPPCRDCLKFDEVVVPALLTRRYRFEGEEDLGDECDFYLCADCQLARSRVAADREMKCPSVLEAP